MKTKIFFLMVLLWSGSSLAAAKAPKTLHFLAPGNSADAEAVQPVLNIFCEELRSQTQAKTECVYLNDLSEILKKIKSKTIRHAIIDPGFHSYLLQQKIVFQDIVKVVADYTDKPHSELYLLGADKQAKPTQTIYHDRFLTEGVHPPLTESFLASLGAGEAKLVYTDNLLLKLSNLQKSGEKADVIFDGFQYRSYVRYGDKIPAFQNLHLKSSAKQLEPGRVVEFGKALTVENEWVEQLTRFHSSQTGKVAIGQLRLKRFQR